MTAGLTASAQAADIPYGSRAPYTVNQPLNAYSWAGPYLGGNIGYAWGSVDNNPTRPSGFAGGVQGGYNWQNGPLVFGLEADIQASGANDTFAPWKFSNPWFGTVRGRVGYAVNNVLFYGTGGLAFGELRGRGFRPDGNPYHRRLDRGRRRRIRLRAELDREDRISLRRSVRQPFRHHRHAQRLPVRPGPPRRELSLLVSTRKTCSSTPGRSRPGFFCRRPRRAA